MKDAFPTLSDSALFIAADNARPGALKTALQAEIDRRHEGARAEYSALMTATMASAKAKLEAHRYDLASLTPQERAALTA